MFVIRKARRSPLKLAAAAGFLVLLPIWVGAYTLVLRDGRRIEIPDSYTVTQNTLTYERAPGFNVTLQLALVDIAATERVNNQTPGSFFKPPAGVDQVASRALGSTAHSPVNITNAELESTRRARLKSERVYEQRRRELGLPTIAQTRQREQQEAEAIGGLLQARRIQSERNEEYWRGRAWELRAELAETQARINYLNGRLAELPESRPFATGFIGGVGAFGSAPMFGRGGFRTSPRPGTYVAPAAGSRLMGQLRFGGGAVRARATLNSGVGRGPFGYGHRGYSPVAPFPYGLGYSSILTQPFSFDSYYDRAAINQQLQDLLLTRAGLQARWRLLEEEARREGVPPGWLRP